MARRTKMSMARRVPLLLVCCLLLALLALSSLPTASAQGEAVVEPATDEASATDEKEDGKVGEAAGGEDTIDVVVRDAEDIEAEAAAVENDLAEKDGVEAARTAAAAATVGGNSKMGHKGCKWSWSSKRCIPTDLCQYQYQFLDALPSESCRLKNYTHKRKVFKNPDIEVKPAYAIAGAAGLFAGDLVAIRYTNWLQKSPLLFNIVQGFVLFVSGDTLFQVLEQGWQKVVGLKWWRAVRSGLIGALNNGLVHYSYYKWIDSRFPYHKFTEKRWGPKDGAKSKLAIGFTKWAIEWPTIGLYKIASMYILTAAMSGSMNTVLERMKDGLLLTQLRGLQVWPIYDMILYAYVPTAHRPLFNSFMSILWGGYLSHVSQPAEAEDEVEGVQEATS